jgi:hypothetical protein
MGHQLQVVAHMQLQNLKGNLLSLYLAVALESSKKGLIRAPWDDWQCDIIFNRREFGPFDTPQAVSNPNTLHAIMPLVAQWQLSSRPIGSGRWLVETPDGQSYIGSSLIHAYTLAVIGSTLGQELPDWYEDANLHVSVFLPPFNVEYGTEGPNASSPTVLTFKSNSHERATYCEALAKAKAMTAEALAFNYTCDGHSWVQVQLMDGTVHTLYQGASTLGLPACTPP